MRSGAHSQRHFERERLAGQSGAGRPPIPERRRRRNLGLIVGAALLLVSALVIAVNALAGAPGREALVATTGASQNLAGAPRQEALVATTGPSRNLVANGGFESGTASWTVSDLKLVTSPTHSGSHSVQLCGYAGCVGNLSQAVRLPTPATALTFGYWILVQPGGSASVACSASVQATLRTTSGGLITTVGTTCSSAPSGAWTWVHADVSAPLAGYAGEKVSVRFHGKSGRDDDTGFVVDDVSLVTGTTTMPAAAPTATLAPTPSASLRTTATPAAATPAAAPTPHPTPPLAPAAAPAAAPAGRWIPPLGNVPWQWEIDHPLDLASASDMGTGVTTYSGAAAPNPVVYDIDGFDNSAATVAALHARGAHVICYIEVGAAENYRPDYSQFPASALGNVLQGYSNERYLDIRSSAVVGVIENRIAMCAQKGFDAIEPDIDDSYTENTGFGLTMADDVAFNRTLANYAHGLGLSYGLKNGDDPSYAAQMLPIVDFALDEQCFEYSTCGAFFPSFRNAGKAVFEVEYNISTPSFCPQAVSDGFNAVRQNVNLNGGRQPCS